ncbi:MAG: helix-turn-helix domain-containing protein [Phycisphaerae bacterium]|nr:helix-turn-helix domain-containing protein [Phycisphaerae bacterium]
MFQIPKEQPIQPLLLTASQAARALSLCEKTLWTLTKRGEIPAVRIGRAVRYDPRDLDAWIERAKNSRIASCFFESR